ncbi:hypothetical protein J6590_054709 [Homalodisca vitripennis]|nr:hypothetical protein J6590_054709 [Homalodisca vitripennis]
MYVYRIVMYFLSQIVLEQSSLLAMTASASPTTDSVMVSQTARIIQMNLSAVEVNVRPMSGNAATPDACHKPSDVTELMTAETHQMRATAQQSRRNEPNLTSPHLDQRNKQYLKQISSFLQVFMLFLVKNICFKWTNFFNFKS